MCVLQGQTGPRTTVCEGSHCLRTTAWRARGYSECAEPGGHVPPCALSRLVQLCDFPVRAHVPVWQVSVHHTLVVCLTGVPDVIRPIVDPRSAPHGAHVVLLFTLNIHTHASTHANLAVSRHSAWPPIDAFLHTTHCSKPQLIAVGAVQWCVVCLRHDRRVHNVLRGRSGKSNAHACRARQATPGRVLVESVGAGSAGGCRSRRIVGLSACERGFH